MPPLPVIADTYRVTLDWSGASSVGAKNVFHVYAPGGDVAGVGGAIDGAFDDGNAAGNLWQCVTSTAFFSSYEVLPLDGSTGTQIFAPTNAQQGQVSGDYIPQSAGVISFKTAIRGPRGRGRMYLGPVGESVQDNGQMHSTTAASLLAAWAAFIASLDTASCPLTIASYVHRDQHVVTSHRVDQYMGTQRRRQDRIAGR